MKFFTFFLICFLTIAFGFVYSKDVIYSSTSLDWKQSTPLYTGENSIFMIDTDKQNVLTTTTNAGQSWQVATDNKGNQIVGSAGYIYKRGYMMVVDMYLRKTTTFSVSSDNGVTFTTVTHPYPIFSIEPHDDIDGLVIARSNQYILISKDFGLTWTNTSAETNSNTLFKSFAYSEPLWDISENEPVFFAILSGKGGVGVFSVSKDLGKTYKPILNGAVDTIHTESYFYVGVVDPVKGGNKLYVKSLLDKAPTTLDGFLLCEFPFGDELQPTDFRILDDSAGAIFMGISTSSNGQASTKIYGTVYVSNGAGNIFTLSKKYVRQQNNIYDFMPMYGAPGSYLFNQVDNFDQKNPTSVDIKSFISYDNGGSWGRLKIPDGERCTNGILKNCHLNVHGVSAFATKGYGPFYSIASAPGLVLATGTFNPVLSSTPIKDRLSTVISTDNGQSWSKFVNGPSIYEFGAYGSIIIYASALEDTNTISYSFDQGKTSQSFQISPTNKYDIVNIITDPSNSGYKFLLLVEDSNNDPSIVAVDLTPVLPSPCQDSDLILITSNCVLGQKRTYSSVKPTSSCYLNKPRSLSIEACQCTVNDFECDIGYESLDSSEASSTSSELRCSVSSSSYVPITDANCVPGELYYISKGFRMVAGSQCVGGVNSTYAPTAVMCPGLKSSGHGKGWVAAVVIGILLIAGGGFTFYLYKFNPELKQKLMKKVGLSGKTGPKYSVVGIKPNSLADDEFGIEEDDAQILNDNDLQDDDF